MKTKQEATARLNVNCVTKDGVTATIIGLHTTVEAAARSIKRKGLTGYQGTGERRIRIATVLPNDNYRIGDIVEF